MLGSFGHPVPVPWAPTVTVEAAPSSYSPKLFLALGPGDKTVSLHSWMTLCTPVSRLLPALLHRVRTSGAGLHPGQLPWNLLQLSIFGREHWTKSQKVEFWALSFHSWTLGMFCSMHQMFSACFPLSCHQSCL